MPRFSRPPPCAFLFLGEDQAEKCLTLDETFLSALRFADPKGATSARIYRGRLILGQLAYRATSISIEPQRRTKSGRVVSQISLSKTADMGLYAVLVGDLVESSLAQWNTLNSKKIWHQLANCPVDATVVSSLSADLAKVMDKRLRAHPKYIGALVPDFGNPFHRDLFMDSLFKDAFVRSGRLHLQAGYEGDYDGSFFGARTFSSKREVVLPIAEFEKRAPKPRVPRRLSARGLISEMRMARRAMSSVHEKVLAGLHQSETTRRASSDFSWDLGQLPSAPEQVVVQARKLTEYLLDAGHPKGASKARFFRNELEITRADAPLLQAQLIDGLEKVMFEEVRIDAHGIRFKAVLPVRGKNGATATIETGWIIRPGERAAFVTAFPAAKDVELERMAVTPAIVPDVLAGPARWTALYGLAEAAGARAAEVCIPKPIVVDGRVYMEGNCGGAFVVVQDARRGFARWLKAHGIGRPGYPRGYEVSAMNCGQSADKAIAYAQAFAKVLRRNGVPCTVESYVD